MVMIMIKESSLNLHKQKVFTTLIILPKQLIRVVIVAFNDGENCNEIMQLDKRVDKRV